MRLIRAMILLQLCLIFMGCSNSHTYGPYSGKVVDIEKKMPIEGAAVLVVFYAQEPGPAGSISRYADALETLTDQNGEFRFPEHKVKSKKWRYGLNPNGYFTIFKPGYGCYPKHKDVEPMFVPNGTLPPKETVTVILPKIKTKEESLDMPSLNFDIPYEIQKNLVELVNQEMERLGASGRYTRESFGR